MQGKIDVEEVLELVFSGGVDINVSAENNLTPLMWASQSSSSILIESLIDLGADVNAQTTDSEVTPLMFATPFESLHGHSHINGKWR